MTPTPTTWPDYIIYGLILATIIAVGIAAYFAIPSPYDGDDDDDEPNA